MGSIIDKAKELGLLDSYPALNQKIEEEQQVLENLRLQMDRIRKQLHEYHLDDFAGRIKANEILLLEKRERTLQQLIDNSQRKLKAYHMQADMVKRAKYEAAVTHKRSVILVFEDSGQDSLRWKVNAEGVIVEALPFNASDFNHMKVLFPLSITAGDYPKLYDAKESISPDMKLEPTIHRVKEVLYV